MPAALRPAPGRRSAGPRAAARGCVPGRRPPGAASCAVNLS